MKLSEKNLGDVIKELFPSYTLLVPQKRFKGENQTFVVDYYLEIGDDKFVFEFDGPTHFCNTKTQIRDLCLYDFCIENEITLVRIPYFIQVDCGTIYGLFDYNTIDKYKLNKSIKNIECTYTSGFHDSKIVYPGDFNIHGWNIFWNLYCKFNEVNRQSVMQSIYESLTYMDDLEITLGVGWGKHKEKSDFVKNYPT